jgi:hypothetical protein
MGEDKIDFVIAWVDGADPEWRKEFSRWRRLCTPPCESGDKQDGGEGPGRGGSGVADASIYASVDASLERYRDWDNLRYWFRGVEKFSPWVNRIHFITWGHLPAWLDTSNPKLNIVNHRDYIPREYLPTFSSCPIELNMHRIGGLEEKFVYFNDDVFLCRPAGRERFFRGGLPCDFARLSVIRGERVGHNALECVGVINRRHDKKKSIRRNAGKWFNYRYPVADMLKTLTLMPWSFFPGFRDLHVSQPFLRGTFEKLWDEEFHALDAASRHRFRTPTDLSQWLMHYEQLAAGDFAPHSCRDVSSMQLSEENMESIAEAVRSQRYSVICLNDNGAIRDFDSLKAQLNAAFEAILPEKSSYER